MFANDVVALYPRLKRYASCLVTPQEIDDLVQETVMKALDRADYYQEGNLFGWLSVLMHRTCQDQRRSARRKAWQHVEIPEEVMQSVASSYPQQETIVLAHEMLRAMATLEDGQRKVLEMSLLLERPYADIAKALDIPHGTVMSRLSRGRVALARVGSVQSAKRKRVVRTHCMRGHSLEDGKRYISPTTGSVRCRICDLLTGRVYVAKPPSRVFPTDRAVAMRREGKTIREISETLGWHQNSVYRHLMKVGA